MMAHVKEIFHSPMTRNAYKSYSNLNSIMVIMRWDLAMVLSSRLLVWVSVAPTTPKCSKEVQPEGSNHQLLAILNCPQGDDPVTWRIHAEGRTAGPALFAPRPSRDVPPPPDR